MEAPEKLYLSKNIYSTFLYQVPDPDDESCVEYTRTDAFIKNACEWMDEHCKLLTSKDYEDFRKYMKGE